MPSYQNTKLQGNFLQRMLKNAVDHKILHQLDDLITKAQKLGLPNTDIENALIDIEYNESELAFDLIVTQMYEHEIKIDNEFYDLAMSICDTLKLERQKFSFLNELKEKQ